MKVSSIIIIIITFSIFCGLGIVTVDSQTDSCSANLNLAGLVGFDTTSLTCSSVWSSHNYVLRHTQSGPTTWSFLLSAPAVNAYIAMGFSSDGQMVGSSAVVGWMSTNGGTIKQYSLEGQSPSLVKPDKGNLVIANSSIISQNGRTFLAFQLITDQPQTRLIYSIGQPGALPDAPNYQLTEHQDKVSTVIDYESGQGKTTQRPYSRLRKSHGLISIVSWGFLMIVGAMVARYCREWDPQWFYLHAVIQSGAFSLGVIGIICGLVLAGRISANVSTHKGIGIFILVLASLQLTALLARPDKLSKTRKYWNWYHHNAGRLLFILAAANIFYGIHLGKEGSGWNAGYGIVLALLVATFIGLEIRNITRK